MVAKQEVITNPAEKVGNSISEDRMVRARQRMENKEVENFQELEELFEVRAEIANDPELHALLSTLGNGLFEPTIEGDDVDNYGKPGHLFPTSIRVNSIAKNNKYGYAYYSVHIAHSHGFIKPGHNLAPERASKLRISLHYIVERFDGVVIPKLKNGSVDFDTKEELLDYLAELAVIQSNMEDR